MSTFSRHFGTNSKIKFNKESNSLNLAKNHAEKQISSTLNKGIGILYE